MFVPVFAEHVVGVFPAGHNILGQYREYQIG